MLGKLPTALGQTQYWLIRAVDRRTRHVEKESIVCGRLDE